VTVTVRVSRLLTITAGVATAPKLITVGGLAGTENQFGTPLMHV